MSLKLFKFKQIKETMGNNSYSKIVILMAVKNQLNCMKLTLGKVAASKLLILTSLISRGKISDVDLKNCIGCMDRILKWKAQTEKMKYLSTNTQIIYQNHYLKSQLLHSPINNMHNRLTNKDWQQKHRNRLYIYHIKRH